MECLEMPVWTEYTEKELRNIRIIPPDEAIRKQIMCRWDAVAKPLESLGRLETMTAQIGAVLQDTELETDRKAVLIMCADNGIVEENISQSGQEVTAAVVEKMGQMQSPVGKMAAIIGVHTIPVDIGINKETPIPGVLDKKIRCGTRNFKKEPALTEQEAVQAIAAGIELVGECRKNGYKILATGEMGIGNTTTSSAVTAALLHLPAALVTGRGAGLSTEGMLHKQQIIEEAIEKYALRSASPMEILTAVGGLDIAGLAGVCIGGAIFHLPIVLDGVISMASALLAERLVPGTKEFLVGSHKGKEPAVRFLAKELGIEPVIDAQLALGEGTGAVMLFSLLEMALSLYRDRTTFADIKIAPYERFGQ